MLGIDGQVRHLPHRVVARQRLHALLDGVLVRARERGVDEIAHVRMARMARAGDCSTRGDAAQPSMSVMSSSGSIPCAKRFMARVTTSTLPVRSPLPNSVPSTRSAPASTPSSAAATAQPRSLWGCSDRTTRSRREMRPQEPLDRVGVDVRAVHLHRRGQVQDDLCPASGSMTSMTASQISTANSTSVPV